VSRMKVVGERCFLEYRWRPRIEVKGMENRPRMNVEKLFVGKEPHHVMRVALGEPAIKYFRFT